MTDFNRQDVERSFTKTILIRGADYVRMRFVLDAWYTRDGDLCGKVSGSESQPYMVRISFRARIQFVELESGCTCPYNSQCKHAAALALYALNHELRVLEASPQDGKAPAIQMELPKAIPVSTELPLPYEVDSWLNDVERGVIKPRSEQIAGTRISYILGVKEVAVGAEIPTVTVVAANATQAGAWGSSAEIKLGTLGSNQRPKGWGDYDFDLVHSLYKDCSRIDFNRPEFRLDGRHGDRLMREIMQTDRAMWKSGIHLREGEPRHGEISWEQVGNKGVLRPKIAIGSSGRALAINPPWYVDVTNCECGLLECEIPGEAAAVFARGGIVPLEHIGTVRERLLRIGIAGSALPPEEIKTAVRAPLPVPCFVVEFESCEKEVDYKRSRKISAPVAFGKLTFEYEGHRAPADGSDIRKADGNDIVILRRNEPAEALAADYLTRCGWSDAKYSSWEIPRGRGTSFCITPPDSDRLLDPLERVDAFVKNVVPKLTAAGWRIQVDQNYRFIPESEIEWDIGVDGGSGIDWFEVQLGIRVEGKAYDLRPVLVSLFKELATHGSGLGAIARTQKSDDLFMFGTGGQVIRLSRKRLNAILQPLTEIFGGASDWPDTFKLPKALAGEASKLKDTMDGFAVPWKTTAELARLGEKFAKFDKLEPLMEPEGFCGELRPYQREGLAWLQFLGEFAFGGILADDMGLGKTVQVLAHIQTEKRSGRMDRPCLIVAPTSTIPNWMRECERFVPDLKVVSLQGGGRKERFAAVPQADIALTTYPLLARDKGDLLRVAYHMIVLDEAQNVKNAATAAAKAARDLIGNHKLCLSGTPVENHLGELWSLFQFLMPSFLGPESEFKKQFRVPIEKAGDSVARDRLARRVRPFMLRRTKGQVVKELPPKTVIVETVAFEDPQRDLYESIRVAMDEQVRNLIAAQGFDRSRIQILDALLKLRQVCCDPRLVKLNSARSVTHSAKLDRLLEMLRVLLEDGRRVLLFSQFTSMLDLIELRLREEGMQWVRISGDTTDRETPVLRFQACEVPLFLISLKAGGTGLNLTAADTVILYDPWWNPAVENQAIDRAHRIGQDKAVIVYKLVAGGTIEEKMLEMQARKGDIARSILTEDAEGIRTLTVDDLRWVLSSD